MASTKHIVPKKLIPETPADSDDARIIERPNGFYWQSAGGAEYGPFRSLLEASEDMARGDDEGPEPGESLQEAEAEIGIGDWIDPDTGEPAELDGAHLEEH